jgi:hypothetical protein
MPLSFPTSQRTVCNTVSTAPAWTDLNACAAVLRGVRCKLVMIPFSSVQLLGVGLAEHIVPAAASDDMWCLCMCVCTDPAETWVRVNWMLDRLHNAAPAAAVTIFLDCCRQVLGSAPHDLPILIGNRFDIPWRVPVASQTGTGLCSPLMHPCIPLFNPRKGALPNQAYSVCVIIPGWGVWWGVWWGATSGLAQGGWHWLLSEFVSMRGTKAQAPSPCFLQLWSRPSICDRGGKLFAGAPWPSKWAVHRRIARPLTHRWPCETLIGNTR